VRLGMKEGQGQSNGITGLFLCATLIGTEMGHI
jgi:hypothetical protein